MKFLPNTFAIVCILFLAPLANAGDAVLGVESTFESYNGVVEKCVRILPVPGGEYDKDDIQEEMDLCEVDFYSDEIALCPKIWSTSAAVVAYDISSGQFEGERRSFQELVCAGGIVAKYVAKDVVGKLKFTMNQATTSGVFSTSSLLYYHLSRYFDTSVRIPVAVWRNMDAHVLLGEVANGGAYFTENNNRKTLNNAAWHTLVDLINDPLTYVRAGSYGYPEDILTSDGDKAYGVLLDASGRTTGPELDSSVGSTWSVRSYDDLQNIPEFIALASEAPLSEAIMLGLLKGTIELTEEQMLAAILSPQQVAFSMRDLSEILLMDFIMTQQDRLGNIDYKAYYYWTNNGFVARAAAKGRKLGKGGVPEDAVLILRAELNDNDTGGRYEYDNLTKLAGVLERLRHFDAKTYRLLMKLDADLQSNGPIYTWMYNSLGLRASKVQQIVDNTTLAASILRATCKTGNLRFDLEPKQFFANGYTRNEVQPCTINKGPQSNADGPFKLIGPQ